MATYDEELLNASRILLGRKSGQRGRLPSARIRRSISTTYYALFHFILDEASRRIVGAGNDVKIRRRLLSRTISHTGMKLALDKVRGSSVDPSVAEFLRFGNGMGQVAVPTFMRDLALAFSDAHAKRQDADYNLNATLSAADARLLRLRVKRVIKRWRAATSSVDRDAKHALSVLILMKGQLRSDR
jgi:hypothetical protein